MRTNMHDEPNDDDIEDAPVMPGTPAERPLTTTITGYDAERVERLLVAHLAEQMTKSALDVIRSEARALAVERVKAVCGEMIDAETRRIVEAGWDEVKPWGERTGERFTVRSYLMKYLTTETYDDRSSNYGPRHTPVDRAIKTAIEAVFSREFQAEIDAARKRLRKALDDDLAARLASTIKGALGLG
jgi:hypothetical protein